MGITRLKDSASHSTGGVIVTLIQLSISVSWCSPNSTAHNTLIVRKLYFLKLSNKFVLTCSCGDQGIQHDMLVTSMNSASYITRELAVSNYRRDSFWLTVTLK